MRMSAYEMGGLFAPPPPPLMGVGHHFPAALGGAGAPPIWGPTQAGPMNPLLPSPASHSPFAPQSVGNLSGLGLHNNAPGSFPPSAHSQPSLPLDLTPKPPETIKGYGQLTWLSSKAGLITCKDKMVISFQIKDFCDQQLTDLTSVLRVGFTLSFQASLSESQEYIATLVSPLYGQESDNVFANAAEVNLEKLMPVPPNSKDSYGAAEEARAIPALLAIFQRHSLPQIQLSSMHSQMSSCGDEELFRYVGSSSLKRRQFVERRTHLFKLNSDDTIALQPPWIYNCVCLLTSRLLRRGGATAIQSLYDFYCSPEMPADVRACIGEGRSEFLSLIQSHPWIFALFPNRTYVSVRRNLPHFEYSSWIKQTFPDSDAFRPPAALQQNFQAGAPRGVMRSLSHQPLASALSSGTGSRGAPPAPVGVGGRPQSLWDSQMSLVSPLTGPAEAWSPLLSSTNSAWRHSPAPTPNSTFMGSSTPTHGSQKVLVSASTQTSSRPMIGQGECTCRCQCGRGNSQQQQQGQGIGFGSNLSGSSVIGSLAGAIGGGPFSTAMSRASGGSASPPSLESASPASGGPSSPSPAPPMRYYDPFGAGGLSGFDGLGFSKLNIQ